MLTPMSVAVSASWATARMPRPRRLVLTKRSRATIMMTAPTTTTTLSTLTIAPWGRVNSLVGFNMLCRKWSLRPSMNTR